MRFRLLIGSAFLAGMTGACIPTDLCKPQTDFVGVSPFPVDLWTGDKLTLTATSGSNNELCPQTFPTSAERPGDYAFTIADPAIASISPASEITGLQAGTTSVTVTRGASPVSGYVPIFVARPIERLEIVATPASPKVGDTVDVVTNAIDFAGQPTVGAHFTGFSLDPIPVSGGTNPVGITVSDSHMRLVIKSAGRYTMTNSVKRRGAVVLSASLAVIVP